MMQCKELSERHMNAAALIGMMEYKDGSMMPSVFLDISKDAPLQVRANELFSDKSLKKIQIHINEDMSVSVEGAKEYLDGSRADDLILKFTPECSDDIDFFLGYMELTHSWVFIIQLLDKEFHFIVASDSDEIMYRYKTKSTGEFKKFKVEERQS